MILRVRGDRVRNLLLEQHVALKVAEARAAAAVAHNRLADNLALEAHAHGEVGGRAAEDVGERALVVGKLEGREEAERAEVERHEAAGRRAGRGC